MSIPGLPGNGCVDLWGPRPLPTVVVIIVVVYVSWGMAPGPAIRLAAALAGLAAAAREVAQAALECMSPA